MLLKRKVDIETAKADIEGVNSLHKTAQNKSADRYITRVRGMLRSEIMIPHVEALKHFKMNS